MPNYKKTIKAGDVLEVEYYHSIRKRSPIALMRKPNCSITTEKQRILNEINSKKHFQRLINANFSRKAGDLYITLTYENKTDEKTARKDINNFIRRLRYYRNKQGLPPLKCIGVIEKGKKGVNFHHHLIINKIDMNILSDLWNMGRVRISKLDRNTDYTALANYLSKENHQTKRFIQSRNLKQPKIKCVEVKKIKDTTTAKPPKGYILVDSKTHCSDIAGVVQYAKYMRINI